MKLTTKLLRKLIKEAMNEADWSPDAPLAEDSDEPYGGDVDARRAAKWNKPSRRSTGGGGNSPLTTLKRWQGLKGLLTMDPSLRIGMSTASFREMEDLANTEPDIADALAKGRLFDNGQGPQSEE